MSIHNSAPFIGTYFPLMFSLTCMCMYVNVLVCMYVCAYKFPVSCLWLCRMCIVSFLPGWISIFGASRLVCSVPYSWTLLFCEKKKWKCIHVTVPVAVHIVLSMFIYSLSSYLSLRVHNICVNSALRTYLPPHVHWGFPLCFLLRVCVCM